jgi:hypothetical protein
VSVFLPLLVLPNAFKKNSLLQISSILSQFLLLLSLPRFKEFASGCFSPGGLFSWCFKASSSSIIIGFPANAFPSLSLQDFFPQTVCRRTKRYFVHNLPPLDSPLIIIIIIIIHTVDSLKTIFVIGPRVGNQTWRWWSLYSSGGCCKAP